MDWQMAFNWAAGGLGTIGMAILKVIWSNHKELSRDVSTLKESLPETYTRRDDFKDTVKALFDKLDRIENKLDHKVDR